MQADLSDLRYLYRYGAYIGDNERQIAAYLNTLPEADIQAMADTYTEGYRIGFETTGKDLSKKTAAQVRYPIGFERMVRAAVRKQYDYDHREDRAYYLDKAYVERGLETWKNAFEEEKVHADGMAGPAVIEVFGEEPFSPETKKEAFRYSEKQQQLCVYEMSQRGQITNQYIKGEERSFTIIAYPLPSIGARFEDIFAETVKIELFSLMSESSQNPLNGISSTGLFAPRRIACTSPEKEPIRPTYMSTSGSFRIPKERLHLRTVWRT